MNKAYVAAILKFDQELCEECRDMFAISVSGQSQAAWWKTVEERVAALQQLAEAFPDQYTPVPGETMCSFGPGVYWAILLPSEQRKVKPKKRDSFHFNNLPTLSLSASPLSVKLEQLIHLAAALNMGLRALQDLPD